MEHEVNKNDHISRINCKVDNCVYHNRKNQCCADKVTVGPDHADDCDTTNCSTFKKKF